MPDQQFNPTDYEDPMVVRILDAAEQCIHRFGIRRTSMGEVARVGKLSRGSIYRHFGDKESLVEGVFRRRQQEFLNSTEAALEKLPSLVDKVTHSVVSGRKRSVSKPFNRWSKNKGSEEFAKKVGGAAFDGVGKLLALVKSKVSGRAEEAFLEYHRGP